MIREGQNEYKTPVVRRTYADWRTLRASHITRNTHTISGYTAFQAVGCEFDSRLPLHTLNPSTFNKLSPAYIVPPESGKSTKQGQNQECAR